LSPFYVLKKTDNCQNCVNCINRRKKHGQDHVVHVDGSCEQIAHITGASNQGAQALNPK